MKRNPGSILLRGAVITMVLIILLLSSKQEKPVDDTAVNKDIIQTESFSVTSESTSLKTSAEGTIFVRGSNGKADHIQIVARIEIDPEDWGGVAFYVPHNWHISNITSSYPEGGTESQTTDYAATWSTASTDSKWRAFVEIGRDRTYKPLGGGSGTVVIDIIRDKHPVHPETFNIGIEVGSADNGSYKVMGPDSVEIPISLTPLNGG